MMRDLTIEQLVTERSITDSKKQINLFKINRIVYLSCCIVIAIFAGRTLMGWSSLSSMLIRSGAYEWLCTPQELADAAKYSSGISNNNATSKCIDQEVGLLASFSKGIIASLLSPGLAAILIYYAGERISFLTGTSLLFAGWMLLGYSSQKFDLYGTSMILIGLGMDPTIFSLLSVSNLFPGDEMLITASVASCVIISMVVTKFLDYITYGIGMSFKTIITIYALIVHLLMFVFGIFCVPPRRFYTQNEIEDEVKRIVTASKIHSHTNLEDGFKQSSLSEIELQDKSNLSGMEIIKSMSITEHNEPITDINSNNKNKKVPKIITTLILIHYLLIIAESTYLTLSMKYILGPAAINLSAVILPLSSIPCLILGKMADKFDVMCVIWYELSSLVLTIILIVLPVPLGVYIVPMIFMFCNACLTTQFWFLVIQIYEPRLRTPTLALITLASSFGTAISQTVHSHFSESSESLKSGLYVFLGICAAQFIIVYIISVKKAKHLSQS